MSLLSQHQPLLQSKLQEFLSLTRLTPSNQWSKATSKEPSLTIHTRKDSKGVTLIRSEGVIPHSRDKVFSVFWDDVEALTRVDDSIASYEVLEMSPDDTQAIVHNKLKPAPLVTPRDMVVILAYLKEKNRTIIYGTSIKYPEEKGFIRAECKVWGWLLSDDEKNKGHTLAISVNYTDLAGRIPSFVVKPVLIKEQGYLIKRARDFLSQHTPVNNKKLFSKREIKPKL